MQTKGLYKALLGKEVAPEEIAPLAGDASDEQKAEWEAKVQQRNKQIEEIEERNNTLNENEKLSEYFIRAQELMSRLTEAGEKISETLFNALVINGLPEKYEHFIVQESFNPAANFTELRTRLQNYDDSRLQRNQAKEDSATAMYSGNTSGRNKGPTKPKGDCFVCGNPGHFAKQCSKRSSAYCSKCKKKGHLPKACRGSSKPDKSTKEPNSFASYSQCMNSGTKTSSGTGKPNHLIIDTGCTDHIISQKELFENLQPCSIKNVKDPKGNFTPVEGIGDVPVKLHLKNGKEEEMVLRNVLYVPNYEVNLLSVNRSVRFGHKFVFNKSEAKLRLNYGPQVDLTEDSGLFYLKITFQRSSACHSTTYNTNKAAIKGELNKDDVKRTIGCEDNLKEVCETCALGKQSSKPVPKETQNKSQKVLKLVYSDILGPFEVPSLSGSRYAITFIDEYSKHSIVKFMSKKSQAFEKFKKYVAEYGTPQRLRTDNGAEYTSKQFKDYCRDSKIKQEFTVPERFNRTVVEMGRSLLIQAKLPKCYWVSSQAAHIRNLTVTANSNHGKSPFELFTGKPPRRNHLRVFGCTAYVMKRKINMKKLDSRSVKAKFIGYDDKSTAYILQEFDSKKIIKARNVIFKENEIQSFSARETMSPDNPNLVSPNMDFEDERSNDEGTKIPVQARVGGNDKTPVVQNPHQVEENPEEDEVALPRESRNRRPPERYGLP
ncbi:Retrovirus-related Pol poly from transposon TNT 1-94 [Paramuricea clavata]|uniref:Retrovirus-related Pol poly from transposon TNT 1-94 n=1 Tax=Paramuricea clavata TaxID=317549 RepID=A0A7D9DU01_PARCT|nr:Retrovirus-related Pol poly from transposon TNT 1-94 [Paramuricea clavata]